MQRGFAPFLVALGMFMLATPRVALSQERALALVGGAWEYDLSGTGTTGFGGLRLEWPVHRLFLLEPALTYARYTSQFSEGINYLIPEIQAQV